MSRRKREEKQRKNDAPCHEPPHSSCSSGSVRLVGAPREGKGKRVGSHLGNLEEVDLSAGGLDLSSDVLSEGTDVTVGLREFRRISR